MSDIKQEKAAINDVIYFYNSQIRTSELTSFEDAEDDQKNLICELYMAAIISGTWPIK